MLVLFVISSEDEFVISRLLAALLASLSLSGLRWQQEVTAALSFRRMKKSTLSVRGPCRGQPPLSGPGPVSLPASISSTKKPLMLWNILCLTPPQLQISGGHSVLICRAGYSIHPNRGVPVMARTNPYQRDEGIASLYFYPADPCHHQIAAAIISDFGAIILMITRVCSSISVVWIHLELQLRTSQDGLF